MGHWSDLWNSMRTWVTDWYKRDVLEEHLTSQALAHRKPVHEALLKAHVPHPENYGRGLPAQPSPEELFNAFMFSGADYRGQAQHAFETLGYGAGVSFAVDLAKIFIPPGVSMFLTLSVSGNFSAKHASHRFLYIANQGKFSEFQLRSLSRPPISHPPRQGDEWRARAVTNLLAVHERDHHETVMALDRAWHPVVLSCMLGKWTNMKGGLGVTVGGKFDTTNLFNLSISDMDSLGFSINLTASASAGLDGTWVFATDPGPTHTEKSRAQMNQWFTTHLKSTTSAQKKEFNQALADQHTDINPSCYLSWWIHTKEASAGLNAGVSATAAIHAGTFNDQTVGPGGTFALSAKLPSIKWTAKTSSYRLNTPCPDPDVVLSQETKILYKQVGGQLFGLAMELELGCAVVKPNPVTYGKTNSVAIGDPQTTFIPEMTQKVDSSPSAFSNYYDKKEHGGPGKTKIMETVAPPDMDLYKSGNFKATLTSKSLKMTFLEDKFKKLEKNWETVNSLSYETGIAFWSKNQRLLLEGSGFVVGQSLTLPSLVKYWNSFEQCRELFGRDIPDLDRVKLFVQDAIKDTLPTEGSVLPTLQNWIASTDTGDWRRAIKAVDEALKAYWQHVDSPPWNGPHDGLPGVLQAQANRNCKPRESDTLEERNRRLCGYVIHLALEEAKARDKLFVQILSGIHKWIASKGGESSAGNNKRFPGIAALRVKCIHEREKLDRMASALDVSREYLEMRTLEAGLAKSLQVGVNNLRTFLRDEGLQGAIIDILNLARQDKGQVPGAFLIEASFKMPAGKLMELSRMQNCFKQDVADIQNEFSEAMKRKLAGSFDEALQYISIRYRKADTRAANRSFKLGVSCGAAQFGFSLDRVRQAGTEGNFMVSTVWFGSYRGANQTGGWPEKTVPMPVILS
ncbi:hypothetical protein SAMN04489760_10440 [Syntrophus gentianae]|uniref:Uncharacterized protein n=1 Tax=Syntrophus gentianae TaxID=43775 RepID=A0A1H7VKS3_9BACT|nr:hypothetical protein [Syntrophus gentianae]SEM09760.1 hypothetical protein SAMN04489760_10440 [Syntrophus gentianae]